MPSPLILYATMTGNTRDAADLLAARLAEKTGAPPRVETMATWNPKRLADEQTVLLLTSTFGNGDPPDCAFAFWDILRKADDLRLANLSFAVAALGDSTYPRFCQYGRDLDRRLAELGAHRLAQPALCDVDWEERFGEWMDKVVAAVAGG